MINVKRLFDKLFIKPINKSGEYWVGFSPFQIAEYLHALASSEQSYSVDAFRLAICECGSDTFLLYADRNKCVARRVCVKCKRKHFIIDSEKFWKDASPTKLKCIKCGTTHTNIGVGFSLRGDGEVRWIYVGSLCVSCGTLGCYVDWKVDYSPSKKLLDQA